MNRKFLEDLGLEKEVVDKVMAEYGKSLKEVEDYEEIKENNQTLQQQIDQLNATLTATNKKYEEQCSKIESVQKKFNAEKTKNLKFVAASQAGLPIDLASRLTGETEDQLKADAEKLIGFMAPKQPLPMADTEPEEVDSKDAALLQTLRNLKGE